MPALNLDKEIAQVLKYTNIIISNISICSLQETNHLMYSTDTTRTEYLGCKINKKKSETMHYQTMHYKPLVVNMKGDSLPPY